MRNDLGVLGMDIRCDLNPRSHIKGVISTASRRIGILHKVLTGHGGFSEYLNCFKYNESSSCICDPTESESITHVLVKCPVFGKDGLEAELEDKLVIDNLHE